MQITKDKKIFYDSIADSMRHILLEVMNVAALDAQDKIESGDYRKKAHIRKLTRRDGALFFIDGRFTFFADLFDLEPTIKPEEWETMRQALEIPERVGGLTWNEYVTERHERQMNGAV